jgi:GNAT superfamily N-acetyltransferase
MELHLNNYRTIPLSNELLNDAIALIETIFPYKPDQKNAKWSLADSLTHPNSDKQYWLAINLDGLIIGIMGLYNDSSDPTTAWLGCFGVHPQHRRLGLGSVLLQFATSEAKERGFSTLRLYSSFDENESASHHLYRKQGFIETRSDKKADKIFFLRKLR